MYLCYVDESGTSSIPGNTSHFILSGLAIPIDKWRICESDIYNLKNRFHLQNSEIHTGWILRPYIEQNKIQSFSQLDLINRKIEVEKQRKREIYKLKKNKNNNALKQVKKNFKKTESYIHLTYDERKNFILELSKIISNWGFARLFAECIDKVYFDPSRSNIEEQSFEQIVSRFEQFLQIMDSNNKNVNSKNFGLIIHDNNETVAKKYTYLMKQFQNKGTLWTDIINIIETPLFVNSELTSMIQIADLCSYSLRRYLENFEDELFNNIFVRADRKDNMVVGIRHFTEQSCNCKICSSRKKI